MSLNETALACLNRNRLLYLGKSLRILLLRVAPVGP